MSEVDDKIVSITFDNDNFEKRLAQTISSLDALNESIKLVGATNGFDGLSESAQDFDISGMGEAIDTIASKFNAMGAVGFAVIQSLTNSAIDFATGVLQKISEPILVGGKNRAENIEQAKFLFRGLGLDIEDTMASAREAVLGTAFGLDVAAKAAAQLGGSGMKAGKEMTGTLRGIAGLAAMSGSSFEEMADIFTSAAGKGTVSGYELQRIAQRGINMAAVLGKQMGHTEAEIREMASEGKISFKEFAKATDEAFGEHATKANETYTGSLANLRAAFSRMGAVFFGPNLEQQRDLYNAITPKVDELTKALTPLIEAFVYIKRLAVDKLIAIFKGLDFSKLSFVIPSVGQGVLNIYKTFSTIVQSIKEAFKDVFPGDFGNLVVSIAVAFKHLTDWIKMGGTTAAMLTSVFHGVFAAISIVIEVVKNIAGLFKDLFVTIADGVGADGNGILRWFAHMGETIFALQQALVTGGGIDEFFDKIRKAISKFVDAIKNFEGPMAFFEHVKEIVTNMFDTSEGVPGADKADRALGRVSDRMEGVRNAFERVGNVLQRIGEALEPVVKVIDWIWENLKTWFTELGNKLAAVMSAGDFNALVDMLNVTLVGGILYVLKKFKDEGLGLDWTGFMGPIRDMLDSVKDTLKAMQMELKAKAILKIAYALGIMTLSIIALSLIDSVALTKSLVAISVAFSQLAAMMLAMNKIVADPKSAAKIGILAGSLMLLATAMGILSISIKVLGDMGWEELVKGLVGVGGGLGLMIKAMNLITKDPEGLIRTGIAMIAIAVAMRILANAMQAFGTMDWGEMAKGLVGVGGGLSLVVKAMNTIDAKDMISAGIGIVAIAVGMRILANAMQAFATMDWGEMAKGLIAVGASLGIIVLLTNTMPAGGMIGIGLGLIAVAVALRIMGEAVQKMGDMDLGTLAKGIGAIAVVLGILAIATYAMEGALPGAAAIVVTAGALLILANVLKEVGNLSFKELIVGLVGIAAVLALLGIAAFALEPVLPAMIGLGVALAMIGGAFALFGVGAMLVVKALEMLVKLGKKGLESFESVLMITARNIPKLMGALVAGFIEGGQEVLKALPTLVKTIKVLLGHILDTITELAPKIGEALTAIFIAGLQLMGDVWPEFVKTGMKIIMGILDGIRANIREITHTVSEIIQNFLDALREEMPSLRESLVSFLATTMKEVAFGLGQLMPTYMIGVGVAFLEGFWTGLTQELGHLGEVIQTIISDVIGFFTSGFGIFSPSKVMLDIGKNVMQGFINGITALLGLVKTFFIELPKKAITWIGNVLTTLVPKGLELLGGLLTGIVNKALDVIAWFGSLPGKIIGWIGNVITTLAQKGKDLITGLYNGITGAVSLVSTWLGNLGYKVITWVGNTLKTLKNAGENLIKGLWNGIKSSIGWLIEKIKGFVSDVVGAVLGFFGVESPSKVFAEIGGRLVEGLGVGIIKMTSYATSAARDLAGNVQDAWDKTELALTAPTIDIGDVNPTITPILDLSLVRKESKNLDKMMSVRTITPDVSIDRAMTLSVATNSQNGSSDEAPTAPATVEQTFIQNNYSPKELSTADIYRSTKSQFALAKEELGVA